uniref:CHK kinase-like domain-containing protein n=1 Tax=Cacopsylla melanoneura TaxID=428564 RepID=A0A8D9E205_9HEMI
METDIENLENVLNLPPNSIIVACAASQLTEASNGFSSSLYQLNVQWKLKEPHGEFLRPDDDAYSLNKAPSLADPKDVAEAATKSTGVMKHIAKLDADSTSVVPAAAAATSNNNNAASRDTDRSGEINLIVKRMPNRSQWISLNSEATFEKELNMYSLLVPSYDEILDQLSRKLYLEDSTIQSNQHNHLFPKFLGGRLNLKNSPDYVDEHAVILLENLKRSGYENCRDSNLDMSHFIAVLTRLAVFHAAGIIIRHDQKYKTTFKNLLKTSRPFFFGAKDKDIELINSRRREATMETVKKFNYDETFNVKLMNILEQTDKKTLPSSETCYSSLLHNDLWVNNIMFKYPDDSKEVEDKGKDEIKDVKFIDLQNTNFGSVAKDFVLLMYTSVDQSAWAYLDMFTLYYHEILVGNLAKYFGDHFVRQYSLDRFRDELKTYACHKFKHIFNVLKQRYGENIDLYEEHLECILDHCIQYDFI